jgi:nucleotide-binding universal stress UspA family protein
VGTILVGIEDSLRGQDAVALASDLARATGAEVLALCAYPYDPRPEAHYNPVMEPPLREGAEQAVARLVDPLRAAATVRIATVADPVPARALLAAADGADLIVIGSSHEGFSGHVLPGSTGERLLAGAPCPVVLAPQGYRLGSHLVNGRIAVGFDGSPTGHAAVRAAAALARATGLRLRVVGVHDPDCAPPARLHVAPGYLRLTDEAQRAERATLERVVAALPNAEAAFLRGDPATELARESQVAECLVIGSRGYGPTPAVLLGTVGVSLARTAECPLLVVPQGVPDPLEALCGELLTNAAG